MPPASIWFDATTIKRLRDLSPVGMSRTEAHVLAGALALDAERVGFCHWNRYSNAVEKLSRSEVQELLERYGTCGGQPRHAKKPKKHPAFRILREFETFMRKSTRKRLGQVRQRLRWESRFVRFNPGDIFVLSGTTWDMLDAAVLEKTSARNRVCLVAFLHDMIPWRFPHQFEDPLVVSRFLRFAEMIGRHASLVLCNSENTSKDFAQFAVEAGIEPGRREVIHLGADSPDPFARQPVGMPEDLLSRGYVLSVGTIQVRKNHQLLYMLWRRFAEEGRGKVPRLVLAGLPGWLTADLMFRIRKDPLVRDSLIVLHHVNDSELSWLYTHSKFTLYPSLYEGWGLPIVESLQHGKPCLASNTSSMPEAGQGLAVHLDPMDFMGWRREILRRFEYPSLLVSESERIRTLFRPRSWQEFSNDFTGRVWSIANSDSVPTRRAGRS
jgi:hypothetical protein